MQDMGAAGIICSTSEMSARGNCGMRIDLDKVPLRQRNMEAWEILLSESQERMLACVKKGREEEVEAIFKKWDLHCEIIGEVIDEDRLLFYYHGSLMADVPASTLVLGGGAPQYDREFKEPAYYQEYKRFDINQVAEPENLREVAWFLIKQPNIASKRWIIRQYDTMVGTINMTTNFPSDAGIVNLKGTNKALALTVDCNSRYVKADPETGTSIAVAEAARNIVCAGGEPVAITNCLNFGNPYNPEAYWQFVGAIKGMGKACEKFNTPVTGGNVSFYNQVTIDGKSIPVNPTPTIGMLGILHDKNQQMTMAFRDKGHMIFLIGESKNDISCSEYLNAWHKIHKSPVPWFDMDQEYQLHRIISELIRRNYIISAHDISEGGLFTALLECSMPLGLGFDITTDAEVREDAFLFGESQGRVIVSVTRHHENDFIDYMMGTNFPFSTLGHVTKGEMRVDDVSFGFIEDARIEYDTAIEKLLAI
jgi:phosphoribosylformylglycinamidine synthase subunit PurL